MTKNHWIFYNVLFCFLYADPFCLASFSSAFHAVMYNPFEPRLLATANSKEGVGLWDVRQPRRYCFIVTFRDLFFRTLSDLEMGADETMNLLLQVFSKFLASWPLCILKN